MKLFRAIVSRIPSVITSFSSILSVLVLIICRPPQAFANISESFLANWMGRLGSVIHSQTLLELSLPGSHNSVSYDFSEFFVPNTCQISGSSSGFLARLLNLNPESGVVTGDWVRSQVKTQDLDLVAQLNNGIRFFDLRTMYMESPASSIFPEAPVPSDVPEVSKSPNYNNWYGLQYVRTHHNSLDFLRQIRGWLDKHPTEIVVLWISKAGNACANGQDQYPGVPVAIKREYWGAIEKIFGDLLVDQVKNPLHKTSLSTLQARNQRVVIYASDYAELTANSPWALDACQIDHRLHRRSDEINGNLTPNKFSLLSLAAAAPSNYSRYSYYLNQLKVFASNRQKKCAAEFKIPGMTDWCPETLVDIAYLTNFYNQSAIDLAVQYHLGLPNAIYVDAIAEGGTILTGRAPDSRDHVRLGKFAYVDSILYVNVQRTCAQNPQGNCQSYLHYLTARRAKYPLQRTTDSAHGRRGDLVPQKILGAPGSQS